MFAHVDVNSFYASCEKVFRPDLKYLPVIVLSNNDGCVIALSKEAKQLGIKMGQPFFKLDTDFLVRHHVHVFSSHYALYGDMSARVMDTLSSLVPAIEIYSIDEAFCDISTLDNLTSLTQLGITIRETVKQHTHLTVGVGIAPSKTLAKLANFAAKTWIKTGGVVDLTDKERQQRLMKITPVSEVWGVGRALSERLQQQDVITAFDLARQSPLDIKNKYSIVLERTVRELNGESCLSLEEDITLQQQIICSRSFGEKVTDFQDMHEAICSYTARAAEKLRVHNQYCQCLTVFIKTSPFQQGTQYYSNQSSTTFSPTQDTRKLIYFAGNALKEIWQEGKFYQKGGIILNHFSSTPLNQFDLFDNGQLDIKSEKLMRVIDKINHSKRHTLFFASQGIKQDWKMKQAYLSPAYTTRLQDIKTVSIG